MMPQQNNNSLKPIERLRQQKRALKIECRRKEDVLAEHWDFLSENVGVLLFNSAISSFRRKMGFGSSSKQEEYSRDELLDESGFASSMGVGQKLWSGLMASTPLIWEIAQPLLMKTLVNKVKSFFTRRKKDDDYDDDYEERPRRRKQKK